MPKPYSTPKGFTLVELLVVITIITILAVIGYTIFHGIGNRAGDAKKKSDINEIAKAYESKFNSVTGEYQPLLGSDFGSGIIPTPPDNTTYEGLLTSNSSTGFRVCAALKDHPSPSCDTSSATCFCKESSQKAYIASSPPPPPPNPPPPPPAAPQILGNNAIGNLPDTGDANYMVGSRFTMGAQNGTATSISVYFSSGSGQYQLAIYTNNAGQPGTLVANTASGTVTAGNWNTQSISASLTADTTYWIIVNQSPSTGLRYTGGGDGGYKPHVFGSWPASINSGFTTSSNAYSLYVTYTPI